MVPPKTEYKLTELGRRLHEPISLLRSGRQNTPTRWTKLSAEEFAME